ncbi:hypothetical protein B0H13DRAFT_1872209 [Mycena leptocephala]|nr:hypothetical protein B0H13DRAFT_1872209 [Mycena leptocephala]
MWLYGHAGAGKSAVAQMMAEKWAAEDALAATFFAARSRVDGRFGKSLLALQIPKLRTVIGMAVEADPVICDGTIEDQAHVLLVNPFQQLDVAEKPYLVAEPLVASDFDHKSNSEQNGSPQLSYWFTCVCFIRGFSTSLPSVSLKT